MAQAGYSLLSRLEAAGLEQRYVRVDVAAAALGCSAGDVLAAAREVARALFKTSNLSQRVWLQSFKSSSTSITHVAWMLGDLDEKIVTIAAQWKDDKGASSGVCVEVSYVAEQNPHRPPS